jgi:hypothetical protein
MDKELKEIIVELDRLTLKTQQESQVHWRYEWPMVQRETWHVQNLLARRKQQVLRRWLKEVETLSGTKNLVCIYELEVGENLNDEERRSTVDLIDN